MLKTHSMVNLPTRTVGVSGIAPKISTPLRCNVPSTLRGESLVAFGNRIKVTPEMKANQIASRQHRRDLYDHDKWVGHRSEQRYLKNITTIPQSRILQGIVGPLGWVTALSTAICTYDWAFQAHYLPEIMPALPTINSGPLALTSFALSLLLVFRTNSSYGRWDEARKMWGGILNRTRNIMTQTCAWFPPEDEVSRQAMFRWTCAFTLTLQSHLQEDADLRTNLSKVMEPEETEMIMNSPHRVVATCQVLGELIQRQNLNIWQGVSMTDNITFFYDALGGCERILRTPIPVSYTRHTSRFLLIWMTFLPFGLFSTCGWSTIPVSAAIGMLLLGIDEIGMQIEEPFGILALNAICGRAETDARQQLKEANTIHSYIKSIKGDTREDASVDIYGIGGATAVPTAARTAVVMAAVKPSDK